VGKDFHDTNYIFLSFVTHYLPAGIVGLIIAVIFSAAMSSTSGEINSLATVTVIDIYRRHVNTKGSDHHYLMASRFATLFLGNLRCWLRAVWQKLRGADRGGQHCWIAVLWWAAGCICAGFLFQIGGRERRVLWRTGGGGGYLRCQFVH